MVRWSDQHTLREVSVAEILRKSLPNIIASKIAAQILDGTYKSGYQLPAERDLIKQFGVSRSTLREALKSLEEINLIEVHDCFSISELVTYESLHISPMGNARDDIEDGFFDLDGKIPCQSDGGLKCFGHPIGASGIRMIYEIYKQLQGKAEPAERQLKGNIRLGLTHNHGGIAGSLVCSVAIFGTA